jgi:NAD(P)-dependent dehydrogenase (short-subunit alcohol dehydrogenase family)
MGVEMARKTWLITGCSTGFGRALAKVVLERGDEVVATARRLELVEDLVAPFGEQAMALRLDITSESDIAAAVAACRERFGKIDVLVNNAGYGETGTVEETGIEVARRLMETNYFGMVAMTHAVVPEMVARRAGQIVNVGSVAGQIGFPGLGYYCASKFAIAGLTESLAAELRLLGIRVILAELGPFATDFTASMTFNMPGPHYDMAALAQRAGNASWSAGADSEQGALTLLKALDDEDPPVRLLLGAEGIATVQLHDARRAEERAKWVSLGSM